MHYNKYEVLNIVAKLSYNYCNQEGAYNVKNTLANFIR